MNEDFTATVLNDYDMAMKSRLWEQFREHFREANLAGAHTMSISGDYGRIPSLIKQIEGLGFEVWQQDGTTWFNWSNLVR